MFFLYFFYFFLFFFNDTATTEIYTLSLHDALPIFKCGARLPRDDVAIDDRSGKGDRHDVACRSEEHTSELQSRLHLVCRLLLEKKKKKKKKHENRIENYQAKQNTDCMHMIK